MTRILWCFMYIPMNTYNVLTFTVIYVVCCVSSTFVGTEPCSMHVKANLSDDGQQLIITRIEMEHNHEINKVQYGLFYFCL